MITEALFMFGGTGYRDVRTYLNNNLCMYRKPLIVIVLIVSLLFMFPGCSKSDNSQTIQRFSENAISSPTGGYIDSIFINSSGDRIYFLHSINSVNDMMEGTSTYPTVEPLPGHTTAPGLEWNTDLYYIEWNGSSWSTPKNLGSAPDGTAINSPGNECCAWLNETETEIIFYRDTFDEPVLGPRGNFRATRTTRNDPWSEPVLLPGDYGSGKQSKDIYRHDIHKTASGDVYLWEHDNLLSNKGRLLYGTWNGSGWDAPADIAGTDSSDEETQPWVSHDELTILFNRRGSSGDTALMRMSRTSTGDPWENPVSVSLQDFADSNGKLIWGEPTLPSTENYMLFIRFNTEQVPWKAQIMYSDGNWVQGYTTPIPLN